MTVSWDETLLNMCRLLADSRADCRRAKHAAILFDCAAEDIISAGYNRLPSGSCLNGDCSRGLLSKEEVPSLASYSHGPGRCDAVHAEVNAIIRAGIRSRGATLYVTGEPCHGCSVVIKGAGVARVVTPYDI